MQWPFWALSGNTGLDEIVHFRSHQIPTSTLEIVGRDVRGSSSVMFDVVAGRGLLVHESRCDLQSDSVHW